MIHNKKGGQYATRSHETEKGSAGVQPFRDSVNGYAKQGGDGQTLPPSVYPVVSFLIRPDPSGRLSPMGDILPGRFLPTKIDTQ